MGRRMHNRAETFDEVFGLRTSKYLLVVPEMGMGKDIVVMNDWNQNVSRRFGRDKLEDAIEYAQDKAAHRDYDGVVVYYPPEEAED